MTKRLSVLILAVLLAALTLAAGCSRGRSDAQLIGEVVTKINSDPKISEKAVSVNANNGVVTLNGSAANDQERAQAANDAAQVEGVKTVVNNLLVAAPPSLQASLQTPVPDEQPAASSAEPAPAPRRAAKPSGYRERRNHTAARTTNAAKAANAASDMPIISSGPAVNTASAAPMAPLPTTNYSVPSVPAPPPPPTPVTVESGTTLNIRLIDPVDTTRNHPGDSFRATLDSPITIGDKVVIPEGADVVGRIAELKDGGRFAGQPQLALELASLSVNGRKYTLHTSQYTRTGKSRGASTAKKVGTGAAIGAIIGGIAGGGKGAAIGAAAGAGMGGGVQAASKPEQVRVDSEALLSFRLESPITVMPVSNVERSANNNFSSSYDSPPPANKNNNNDVVDYSDDSNQTRDPNRPVLKRRPGTGYQGSSTQPE